MTCLVDTCLDLLLFRCYYLFDVKVFQFFFLPLGKVEPKIYNL